MTPCRQLPAKPLARHGNKGIDTIVMPTKLLPLAILLSLPALAGEPTQPSPAHGGWNWSEPYRHHHFSERGTPVVHTFNLEPAFTGRDLFLTQRYHRLDGATEHETELELEWGLTRRLGIILELPYIVEDERPGPSKGGFGDLVIVPRALLHESDRLLLTFQTEVGLPTGDKDFGGDTTIAPGLAAWLDLGNWWTLQGIVGWENNLDADEQAIEFGLGLIKSFDLKNRPTGCNHGDHSHHHTHSGLLNLHLELTGEMGLTGDEDGNTAATGLIGVSYGLESGLELRGGYEFPVTGPTGLDYGFVVGANWHF